MSKVAEDYINQLKSISSDDQLAVLWFLYKDLVKGKITPEAEREGENLGQANSLIDSIKEMSQDEQLQVQKDILAGQRSRRVQYLQIIHFKSKIIFLVSASSRNGTGFGSRIS